MCLMAFNHTEKSEVKVPLEYFYQFFEFPQIIKAGIEKSINSRLANLVANLTGNVREDVQDEVKVTVSEYLKDYDVSLRDQD